ncbi:uncharacterized protein LOC101776219 [Setaria italica]|uniref:uncharacterized protein LOC101776219 n=1 Tax=Setaria italica TaxID=4555 RepID=UPI000BE5E226|nr:uncharacterized protein LOC101776219 [Setaria italica]
MYNADRRSKVFIDGLHYFLEVAKANKPENGFVCCPCFQCNNRKEYSKDSWGTIHSHLFKYGFMPNYLVWTKHGELGVVMEDGEEEEEDDTIPDWVAGQAFAGTTMGEADEDEFAENDPTDDLGQVIRDAYRDCETEKEAAKLQRMIDDHQKLLYPGCQQGHKKLGTTLEFVQWKAKNGVSDKAFQGMLNIVKKILPENNELPSTTYEAKQIICPLGLDVQKIHACPNDCILYRGDEYEKLDACPICEALRYKIRRDDPGDVEGQSPKKRVPAKVMWYFPIIPRLKRLFRNKANAKLMRWHKEDRKEDEMLRHPADRAQWRSIDRTFPDFESEARNIRFGLSTDGFNPFGPKQPGNDIDVYLRPLVDDLLQLWKEEGVRVWDEDRQEIFNLRALLFVTINDWPALSNLSGQTNKGYRACTHCLDDTDSMYLKHCKKVVYMGHRRFLPAHHQLRKSGMHFKGTPDHRKKPAHRNGKRVFEMMKDVYVVFGKGLGSQPVPNDDNGHAPMWKKKSIFWELPYWEILERDNGQHYLRPASYTLSKEEKDSMFECLNSMKVPSGYSSNIKGIINMKQKKFTNLKAHDCHMLMTQLLPVALRGVLPENVRLPLVKLCAFLNAISQKAIDPSKLSKLQNDVVQCLVSFELLFPPSFFNIMTHLLVHLVKEIGILGPVYLHNMWPFERFMAVLKNYVRNRARPEGSIARGYGTEEVIEFCVDFIDSIDSIGVPTSRHEGRLRGMGTLGRKSSLSNDTDLFDKAHYTVLQQSSFVSPYIEQHRQMLAWLARGPATTIVKFQGYEINGYTFYTRAQDQKSTNQNSGVRIDAMDRNNSKESYYGFIQEIWELEYGPLYIPLFLCNWVKLTAVTKDQYGMTIVDLSKIGYSDDPFVLANDVHQVFYVKDMCSKPKRNPEETWEPKCHIVLPGKRKIVGVEDKTDQSDDYDQFDGMPPFAVEVDPSIMLSKEEAPYLRRDHDQGTFVKKCVLALYNATANTAGGATALAASFQFTLVLRNPSARSAARYDRLAAYAAYRGEPLTPATPMPPLAQDAGTAVEVAGWHSMYARCDLLLGVRKAVGNNGAGGRPQQAPLLGDPACNVDM